MKKTHIACLLSILMGMANYASANSAIQTLTKCDSTFFKEIQNDGNLKPIIAMLNISKLKSTGKLSFPINYVSPEGIKANNFIVTYTDFDKYKEMGSNDVKGQFYYWGFESSQPLNEVVNTLSNKIKLIKNGDIYIHNPMIRNTIDSQWTANNASVNGVAPEENSAEKLFIVEKNEEKNVVTIMCTLQGKTSDKDLHFVGLLNK